ncbi:MAG: hypothetical protein BWZ06_01739 [Bacteroidetes bacterium ADurb.BinA261]|nr:MAG: hypothetical protein BWZ06_01739 [Bacteroidetes bacterium ADurb.BinA261]
MNIFFELVFFSYPRDEDINDVFANFVLHGFICLVGSFGRIVFGQNKFVVLSGDHYGIDAKRSSVFGIFDGYLRFGIRTKIGHQVELIFADISQFLQQRMTQIERKRHKIFGFVGCIAKHHSLIAGPLFHWIGFLLNATIDVVRLFMNARKNAARLRFETVFALRVANFGNYVTCHFGHIHIGL